MQAEKRERGGGKSERVVLMFNGGRGEERDGSCVTKKPNSSSVWESARPILLLFPFSSISGCLNIPRSKITLIDLVNLWIEMINVLEMLLYSFTNI